MDELLVAVALKCLVRVKIIIYDKKMARMNFILRVV